MSLQRTDHATDPVLHYRSFRSKSSSHSTLPRISAFFEIGLGGEDAIVDERIRKETLENPPDSSDTTTEPGPATAKAPRTAPYRYSIMSQALVFALAMVLLWPGLRDRTSAGFLSPPGAEAVPLDAPIKNVLDRRGQISPRGNSPTDVCKRWAHMSAVVNNTLYIYGGQATTQASQTDNTWNNNFLSLDLSKTWQIASPALTGLPQPSGPPPVSLGTLWNDLNNLYLYGGEFSWKPVTDPTSFALWSYSIASGTWSEHSNPKDDSGQAVQRAAEGAGVSVPALGRGFYLGGHLDGYTTAGWSQSTDRLYLESTLEYTMPGFSNAALSSKSPTSTDGAYRNISANSAGFPQRADGVLVYVPGYGDSGIILGIAGGTNDTYTQLNIIDVYDIATSKWYKQATAGSTPQFRVNACAVAVSSADGSSTQVYMYGGQSLQPAGAQTQYDDMWILTIPAFAWIQVDQSGQSKPPARAGHSCNVWNGQMVVVGGYVGQDLSCDSPGIYIFNTSGLSWQNQYNHLETDDALNRQASQHDDPNALQGSYGYGVPAQVQAQVGGNVAGAATITQPAQTATQGPLATGKPKTYTVTGTDGALVTQTSSPSSGNTNGSSNNNNNNNNNNGSGVNAGAIAAGTVAGILAILVAYLGFCTWLYRKQLNLYKHHVAMVQREHLIHDQSSATPFIAGAVGARNSGNGASYTDKDRISDHSQRISADNRSRESGGNNTTNSSSNSGGHTGGRLATLNSRNPYNHVPGGRGLATANSSTEDLMGGQEPSFLGVMLNPRRSLRVVNRD